MLCKAVKMKSRPSMYWSKQWVIVGLLSVAAVTGQLDKLPQRTQQSQTEVLKRDGSVAEKSETEGLWERAVDWREERETIQT